MKSFASKWLLILFSLTSLLPAITSAQTTGLVKDIHSGIFSSDPDNMTNVKGTLFFAATENTNYGRELWKSDGTAAGTVLVKDIWPGMAGSGSPRNLISYLGRLFFAANDGASGIELWASDGTAAGTIMITDINTGSSSSDPAGFTISNNTLYFSAYNSTFGIELWKSDGSAAGTVMVKDIYPGTGNSAPLLLTDVNGTIFFTADNGTMGRELWKSDGSAAGTVMVKDIWPGANSSAPDYLVNVNGTLYFTANDGSSGTELWKSDGTQAGTIMIKDIWTGIDSSYPRYLINVSDTLFFQADDSTNGAELWKSDGTAAGTVLVNDINPGAAGSYPKFLKAFNGILIFAAYDGTHGLELWKSDGTAAGTAMVKDICFGTCSSILSNPYFTQIGSVLYHAATDNGTNGTEFGRTDGTAAGTMLVKDIFPGSGSSYPRNLINVNGTLFFQADDGTNGTELWALVSPSSATTTSAITKTSSTTTAASGSTTTTAGVVTTTTGPSGTGTTTSTPGNIPTTVPPAGISIEFTGTPVTGEMPLAVKFINTSQGDIAAFQWDFGDRKSSTEKSPLHKYTAPGTYSVTLKAANAQGEYEKKKNAYIVVKTPPVAADFSAIPISGNAPLEVQFTDLSKGIIQEWYWGFGDIQTSTEQHPVHTYTNPGLYTVDFIVKGRGEASYTVKKDYIRVTQNAPNADFTASSTAGDAPLNIIFTDTSTGTITERLWNFGDGATGTAATQAHTYTVPGAYPVSLTVTGTDGSSTKTMETPVTVKPRVFTFSLSGTITGDAIEGITIGLSGSQQRAAATESDGSYLFSGVSDGYYTVTPFMKGVSFEPPSRNVTAPGPGMSDIDFTAQRQGPVFEIVSASPSPAPADGQTQVTILAQVTHAAGQDSIDSVAIDLSGIGGNEMGTMHDDGIGGDETAGDGLYSLQTTVGIDTPPGLKALAIQAIDMTGLVRTAFVSLEVIHEINDEAPPGSIKKYPFENQISGDTLVIRFSLDVGEAANILRARIAQQSSCLPVLEIFKPDNTPYLSEGVSMSGTATELEIRNADEGIWAYQVTNTCSTAQSFSMQTTTAGTGIVSGSVLDASTGEGLENVTVRTNSNVSSITTGGYYVLLHPAGVFTITASDTAHSPASQSFTLSAGSAVEVNMILGQGADGSSTCFLTNVFPGNKKTSLDLLRRFRDSFLSARPEGRRYRNLYYAYSPEISALIKNDRALKDEIERCVTEHLPVITALINNEPVLPTPLQKDRIKHCLNRIKTKAGQELKKEIDNCISELERGTIFTGILH